MKIGWASVDITPEKPVILLGQVHPRISRSVHDPVTATAMALESETAGSKKSAVLVSCDLCVIPAAFQQRVREEIRSRVPDLDVSRVFLNATHTHTAPLMIGGFYPDPPEGVMTHGEFTDFSVPKIADAVARAWTSRARGSVTWGMGHAAVAHNRRISYFDGKSCMYGKTDRPDFEHVEGYEDHGVNVLFTHDSDGSLSGAAVNLSCPSQETEGERFLSADFWHETRLEIRNRLGENLFILPQCGAAGDQSPHLLLHQRAEDLMLQRKGGTRREEIGRRIASAVEAVHSVSADSAETEPVLRHIVQTVRLPVRRVSEKQYRLSLEIAGKNEEKAKEFVESGHMAFWDWSRNRRIVERYLRQDRQPWYEAEVHAVRIGDIAVVTNPFELYLDFGLRIAAQSPAVQTFTVQLSCDWAGYLPTRRGVAGGGYGSEDADNTVGPEGGQELVERTLDMLNELWKP